jgi:hypothetical protein
VGVAVRRIAVLPLILPLLIATSPVAAGKEMPGPGSPAYDVQLTANESGTTWTGRERISFTNTSTSPMPEIYLRLWGNSWDGCTNSPVRVSRIEGGVVGPLAVGCTALKVLLEKALEPGERASVAFDVAITAPNRGEQFGRSGAYSFFGNALPVLAVQDQTGWHLEPDVGIGESYYTLAADFTVRLDHPASLVVPATGVMAGSNVSVAKQVRDFAWAVGPFQQAEVTSPGGVKVRLWWTSAVTSAAVADARAKAIAAIDDFSLRFGSYPYGEVDLVLNDKWASFSGMEYPGFVLLIAPAFGEGPVVHELAHQWWYGIVGNNEYADPWLDESFAVYATDLHAGDSRPGCWPGGAWTPGLAITNSMGYWKSYGSAWGRYVYTVGACMLHDLERLIGSAPMAQLLKTYAGEHWYGVSTPAAFKSAAATAATSINLSTFWADHHMN